MKGKRAVMYLILFAMAVSLFAGGISSQAKTKSISLNQKKLTLRVGQKKRLKVRGCLLYAITNRETRCDATANRKADGRTKSDKKAGG